MRPKRCHFCQGRFGLIRHKHQGKQFCSNTVGKACKQKYIAEEAYKRSQSTFYQWLVSK